MASVRILSHGEMLLSCYHADLLHVLLCIADPRFILLFQIKTVYFDCTVVNRLSKLGFG